MSCLTPEERAVINAAIRAFFRPDAIRVPIEIRQAVNALITTCPECNGGGHTCPGDGTPIGHADSDCGEHDDDGPAVSNRPLATDRQAMRAVRDAAEAELRAADVPQWIARTMADVRAGDTIRPILVDPGPEAESRVTGRYLPPQPVKNGMHPDPVMAPVKAGSWHVVSGGAKHWDDHVVQPGEVWLNLDGATEPRMLKPTFGVEILLSPSEAAAIELLGWQNRLEMRTDGNA